MPRIINPPAEEIRLAWLVNRTTQVLGQLRVSSLNSPELMCFLVDLQDRLQHYLPDKELIKPHEMYLAMIEALSDYCGDDDELAVKLTALFPDLIRHFFVIDHQKFGLSMLEFCQPQVNQEQVH